MISIHEDNTTNFNNNGLAVLEPESCIFSPVINDVWQVDITLPLDSEKKYLYVENERILKITGIDCIREQTSEYQLYRIVNHKKDLNHMYIVAWPIGLDARMDTYTRNVKIYNKTATEALAMINAMSNKYTVSGSGYDATKHSTEYENTNMIAVLNGADSSVKNASGESNYQNFVKTWDGEICYDNYNIKVNHRLGDDTDPYDVRYGKNITGMSYTLDNTNIITRLYAYAKSGEALNAISDYAIDQYPYVDAENFSEYPIPHIYYAETPYNLVQLSNDGSKEYEKSHELYEAIKWATAGWLHDALLNDNIYDGLLNEIELDWIINNYALTVVKDGVQGIVEYMARKIWYNEYSTIKSGAVQSLIYNAMKAGFDEVLKNDESQFYIGSASKSILNDGFGDFYSYSWDTDGNYRVNKDAEQDDYVWIYANSKWRQVNDQGYLSGTTDSAKWKWYKKSGKNYKLYGNKKKNRKLHNQWWNINDVWYWFTSDGEGKKGSWLNTTYYEYFDEAEIDYGSGSRTLYEILLSVCIEGEEELFQLLYRQMTAYCMGLFEYDKLSYPTVKLEINMVDLSKTTEYVNYTFLEKIYLGDTVKIFNPIISSQPSTARIIGLKYDVLRGFNTEIKIGITETSVINLLNSIGSSNNDTKIVFGDSFEEVNGKIEVKPPAIPYMTDFLYKGVSVVRNHVGYLDDSDFDLDGIDVLYGEEAPDDETDGENKDFYLQLHVETADIISDTDYGTSATTANPIDISNFVRTDRNHFSLDITGKPNNQGEGETVWFGLHGLVVGNTYNVSITLHYNDSATFPWGELRDRLIIGENNFNFEPKVAEQTVTGSFVYNGEDVCIFTFPKVNDGVVFTCYITDFVITGDFAGEIENLYNKCEGVWKKYEPPVMIGATSSADGEKGSVPKPLIAERDKFLRGDGTWAHDELSKLTDVEITDLADGDVPKWDATEEKWKNGQGGGAISNLTDVELTDLADKEILEWDAVAEKWKNVANSGGGGGAGGSSVYSEKQLYKASEDSFQNISVTWDWEEYDAYIFNAHDTCSTTSYKQNGDSTILTKAQIKNLIDTDLSQYFYRGTNQTTYKFSANAMTAMNNSGGYFVTEIIGLKFGTLSPIIYSEEEREVGVWIDNKPLYQKTIVCNPPIIARANTWTAVTTLSENINVIKTEGVDIEDGEYVQFPFGGNCDVNNVLSILNDAEYPREVIYVTIWYTKTTDVAGSGKYNTLGVPTVHYDDTEKVIGTWFGETLYEKTICTNFTSGQKNCNVEFTGCNIKTLVDFEGLLEETVTVPFGLKGIIGTSSSLTITSRHQYGSYGYIDDTGVTVTRANASNYLPNSPIRITIRYTKQS